MLRGQSSDAPGTLILDHRPLPSMGRSVGRRRPIRHPTPERSTSDSRAFDPPGRNRPHPLSHNALAARKQARISPLSRAHSALRADLIRPTALGYRRDRFRLRAASRDQHRQPEWAASMWSQQLVGHAQDLAHAAAPPLTAFGYGGDRFRLLNRPLSVTGVPAFGYRTDRFRLRGRPLSVTDFPLESRPTSC
jgi:hypothetical protein